MKTKKELIEEYIKEIRNAVSNFDWKVQTSVLLFNFFKSKDYNFYFTPTLTLKKDSKELSKTPDFYINKEKQVDIIGEIKQSLANPSGEDYDKKTKKDLYQLEEYNGEIVGISTPHDVFFASSGLCNEAIAHYIKEIQKNPKLKDKIIVLKYQWTIGGSHSRLTVQKIYGKFTDVEIDKEFDFKDYQVGEGDLNQIQGYYKILYTEEEFNETPIEYIMLVLWHNIFPELIKSADFDKTIERIKKGENTLEFSIDDIMAILDQLYTLRTSKTKRAKQFSRSMIIDAMKSFEQINKAKRLNDSKTNPKYRITHSKIATQKTDLLDYLIRELNEKRFEKKADLEYQKSLHKDINSITKKD